MGQDSRYVGLDVHRETIVAAVVDGTDGRAQFLGKYRNEPEAVRKLVGKLGPVERLRACYEAGPTGYGLQRQLTTLGVACVVVAPSLIPKKAGDRVKTDRRDAEQLAVLLRGGQLTPVWVPDEAHEALRDLSRARETAVQDRTRARNRLTKLLLRQGLEAPAGVRRWTTGYWAWVRGLKLGRVEQQAVLEERLLVVEQGDERVARLTGHLRTAAVSSEHAPLLAGLQCLHGVGLLTAVALVAELGDLTRFPDPRRLMGYSGLVAREHSSGPRTRRGGITKTGNAHVRWLIVEAAWHYRHGPKVGAGLRKRRAGQPAAVVAIADKAQARLHRRYHRLVARGKPSQKAVVAVGRELLGFAWAIAREVAAAQAASAEAA